MTAAGPDRVSEERHSANLKKFGEIDSDLKDNTEQTTRALREIQSVRHNVANLQQLVNDFIYLYREEKKERKEYDAEQKSLMREQAEELRRLSNRFIWATGVIAGVSIVGHFLFDLLSPLTRALLH